MNSTEIDDILTKSIRSVVETEDYAIPSGGRYTYIVTDRDRGATVRQIMKRRLGFSSRLTSKFKRGLGDVRRNGVQVRTFAEVIPGDVIEIVMPDEISHFEPQDIPLSTIFEDDDLIVINKQPGITVHPTRTHPDGTLANAVMKHMLDRDDRYKIRFVNRLDMDTSGVLVVAKNAFCQDAIVKMMRRGEVKKYYCAIVDGIIDDDEGTINAPIGRKQDDTVRRAVTDDGSPSVTHYRVLERFKAGYTFVALRLETGRTHQIRVHMAHIGYPVTGDQLYGREKDSPIARQALHARRIVFKHPVSGETIDAEAPIPDDMAELLKKLRRREY
ncbi:MAG: RluA family pseudouridine synthase [Eubacteriales bacterium]|nr:RluA family pseudouridine synthase [Eubacteriales bacterium]